VTGIGGTAAAGLMAAEPVPRIVAGRSARPCPAGGGGGAAWTPPDAEALRSMAACASSPAERLLPPFAPAAGDAAHLLAQARLGEWRRHVSKGDDARFRRVLGWRGLGLPASAIGLAPARLPGDAPLPDWVDACRRMMRLAGEAAATTPSWPEATPARHAMLVPLVEAASAGPRALLRGLGAAPDLLAPLQRRLLVQLEQLAGRALAEAGRAAAPWDVLLAYPVLARQATTLWGHWIAATEEVLRRFAEDRAALAALLGCTDPGPPEALEIGDADGHGGGRLVVVLAFAGGGRVVYKPRDLALDQAFAGLAESLTEAGLDLVGSVPRVLLRPGYGWAEFIPHRHAADAAGLARYWHRAGQLLGVLTALGGGDMHAGNLIAAGDRPVLVDLETVLCPVIATPADAAPMEGSALARLVALQQASPLGTAMLPVMQHAGGDRHLDIGGLSAPGGERHRAGPGPVEAEMLAHAADLRSGFALALRRMREAAPRLLAQGGLLDGFAGASLRLVFRHTALYARLQQLALRPAMLRDGAEQDVALERLARMLAPHAEAPSFAAVVDAEKRAMAVLDIPRFELAADGTDLRDAQGCVAPSMARQDALGAARQRLAALREADEPWQDRIIALSLQARLVGHAPRQGAAAHTPTEGADPLAAARAIGAVLAGQAVTGVSGDLVWLCPSHDPQGNFVTLSGFNPELGEGCLGIALFLTALARACGGEDAERLRDGALAALRPRGPATAAVSGGYASLAAPPPGLLDGLAGRCWGWAAIHRLGGPSWCLDAAGAAWREAMAQPPGAAWAVADGACGLLLAGIALRGVAPALVTEDALAALARRAADLVAGALPLAEPGLLLGLAGAGRALAQAAAQLGLPEAARTARAALLAPWSRAGGTGWGRGAAGRVLGLRAALVWLGRDDELAGRLATEVDWLRAAPTPGWDSLWDGAAGVLEADPGPARLADLAGRAAAWRLRPVAPAIPGGEFPGLGHGLAGIGYALLRQSDPSLPDLLGFGA
jgi:hypothetical protein